MSVGAPMYTRHFWIGLGVGSVLIAYGARGAVTELTGVQLTSFLRYFVGAALVHDLLVAPAAGAVAWLVARRVPKVAVGPVHAALLVSAVVAVVAWPLVRGYGATPGEPSFLSRDYGTSVLVIWAVVWTSAAAAIMWRIVSARRR